MRQVLRPEHIYFRSKKMPPKKKAKSGGGGKPRTLKSWEENFEILKDWYRGQNQEREYGYNDIPAVELGIREFVKNCRSFAKHSGLSGEQKQKLASISWPEPIESKKKTWDESFEILKDWYRGQNQEREYGYNDIPAEELGIKEFVKTCRSFVKHSGLYGWQKQKLASISWPEPSAQMKWDEHYSALVSFKMANGHFNIPSQGPHKLLFKWLYDQNSSFTSGKLSNDRRSRLEAIGFEFTKRVVVEGFELGYFKPDEADRAEAEAKTILSALDDEARQMSKEAVAYRIVFRLANEHGVVRPNDRIFESRERDGAEVTRIPHNFKPWKSTKFGASVTFMGKQLYLGFCNCHPKEFERVQCLAMHEAFLNDVRGHHGKGKMSKAEFIAILKSRGLYSSDRGGLAEEQRRIVLEHVVGVVSRGGEVKVNYDVISYIISKMSSDAPSDPKLCKKVKYAIRNIRTNMLVKKSDGTHQWKAGAGDIGSVAGSTTSMDLSSENAQKVLLEMNVSAEDGYESFSSIEDDGGFMQPSDDDNASSDEDDDRKPAAANSDDAATDGISAIAADILAAAGHVKQHAEV